MYIIIYNNTNHKYYYYAFYTETVSTNKNIICYNYEKNDMYNSSIMESDYLIDPNIKDMNMLEGAIFFHSAVSLILKLNRGDVILKTKLKKEDLYRITVKHKKTIIDINTLQFEHI